MDVKGAHRSHCIAQANGDYEKAKEIRWIQGLAQARCEDGPMEGFYDTCNRNSNRPVTRNESIPRPKRKNPIG